MSRANGTQPRLPFRDRVACRLVGLGMWLSCARDARPRWRSTNLLASGMNGIAVMNAEGQRRTEQRELAKRQAKPSSRKRVR